MTSPGLNIDSERQLGIRIFGHYLLKALVLILVTAIRMDKQIEGNLQSQLEQ